MSIDVKCNSCGSDLKAPAASAGKKIRCPNCEAISSVPAVSAPSSGIQTQQAPASGQNPYSAPTQTAASNSRQFPELLPLFNALSMIRAAMWGLFIIGGIYCITIVGAIIGWVPIWMGLCLNRAADGIEHGYRSGDPTSVMKATTNLGTFFKIIGVITIIYFVIMGLYLGLVLFAIVMGIVAG